MDCLKKSLSGYLKLKNVNYFNNFVTDLEHLDLNAPGYLKSLMWSAYYAYLLSDEILAKDILELLNTCSFDGDYDKWVWIGDWLI